MGELFAEFGDLVFTLVIGYISAIEFLYVVRHLYHYSCNHDANDEGVDVSQLQDSMRQQLVNAKNKEDLAGTQVMKDGVPYKEGFRLQAQQTLIDQLKEQLKDKELSDLRRQELEKELEKQKKIAEKLRKELAEAEAKYQRQLREEEAAKAKKLLEEEKQREREEHAKKEAEEKARKLAEAEKQREEEQRKRAEEERFRKEAEQKEKERIQREEEQRKAAEEQARKLAEAEKQREAEQRKLEEEEEAERKRKAAEQQEKERAKHEEEQKQRKLAEEQARKLAEAQKQIEAEQRKLEEEEQQRKEAEEEALKLAEAIKQREMEQRQREEAEESARRLLEAEKERQNEERTQQAKREADEARKQQEIAEAEENIQRLLEIEKANEEKQAADEAAAELATKNLLAIEHRLEEQLRAAEREAELTEKERHLIDSIKNHDLNEDEGNAHKEAELLRKILEAREQLGEESEEEQSLRLIQRERDHEAKQKRIEENALLFMEAEKEMAELQSKLLEGVEKRVFSSSLDSAPQTPIVEELCIKRNFSPLSGGESAHSTVKTQLAQAMDEPYSVRTKPLLFPGVSDDASSIDPASSQKSSFSTQLSEDITTGTDSQYPVQDRQEPDGEDNNLTHMQYSDDYLRSLDGIKQRPLMREDGSGRRRAFKKRRSSNSSNSSRESRQSRDEELKMFTSLEEEEMKDTADSEFTPIRYTSEPTTLKVKGHHRRHKRSPAKDMRRGDDSLRSSLERLGEESSSDPWGELKPEQYKHTEFWKREKALSIDEEIEFERPASSEEVAYDTATNMPSASSFEEANRKQNQEALTALQKHSAQKDAEQKKISDPAAPQPAKEESARSDNTNT